MDFIFFGLSKLFAGLVFTLYSLDPNEAAVQALNLFKTRARLCETSDPSKQTDEAMEVRSRKFNILEHFKETIRVISRGTMPVTTVPFKVLSD